MRAKKIPATQQGAEIKPTVVKWGSAPWPLPMIKPLRNVPKPDANCCTEELALMNPPRYFGLTAAVIIAIAGTARPDMQIMNVVVTAIPTTTDTLGKFVMVKIGIVANVDISA